MGTCRRTPDGNGDGNGDGSEDSSGDGNGMAITGTGMAITGTRIGSGRAEERRKSERNRKTVVDAVRGKRGRHGWKEKKM